jgi:hypothetical protein
MPYSGAYGMFADVSLEDEIKKERIKCQQIAYHLDVHNDRVAEVVEKVLRKNKCKTGSN